MTLYAAPENSGLTPVGEVEWENANDFDITAVWPDADDGLYWADDSGCSCPTPFEGHTVDNLIKGSWPELDKHLKDRLDTYLAVGWTSEKEEARLRTSIAVLMARVI